MQRCPKETSFDTKVGIKNGSHGSELEVTDNRGSRIDDKQLEFFSKSTTDLQWCSWCFTVEPCERYQQPSGHWHQCNQHSGTEKK